MGQQHRITPDVISGWFGRERALTAQERRVRDFLKITKRSIGIDQLALYLRFDPTSALTVLSQRGLIIHPGQGGTVRLVEKEREINSESRRGIPAMN